LSLRRKSQSLVLALALSLESLLTSPLPTGVDAPVCGRPTHNQVQGGYTYRARTNLRCRRWTSLTESVHGARCTCWSTRQQDSQGCIPDRAFTRGEQSQLILQCNARLVDEPQPSYLSLSHLPPRHNTWDNCTFAIRSRVRVYNLQRSYT